MAMAIWIRPPCELRPAAIARPDAPEGRGLVPKRSRKALLKVERSPKPLSKAMAETASRRGEQRQRGPAQPRVQQELIGREADGAAEDAQEVELAGRGNRGEPVEVERLGGMRLDVAERPADAARILRRDVLGDGGGARQRPQGGGGEAREAAPRGRAGRAAWLLRFEQNGVRERVAGGRQHGGGEAEARMSRRRLPRSRRNSPARTGRETQRSPLPWSWPHR